ncbi:NAD-dependent epimerase/dehydratase family protein [Pelagibacterales bacterium SAG-MED15]|nr:NAD-dependent epimerase/dehydratase family protein [Pelagibacterales bacterium SAG-MED15]
MHIFITGVAGFLGSNIADYYLKKKFKVSGCDTLIGGNLDYLDKRVKFYKVDCENFDKMTSILKGVDVVLHAAALAHEGLSNFSPHLFVKNNVSGSTSVFTAAIINKVKRIVYCSSMARYGDIKNPFHEEDRPNPVDPYGISKLAAEKLLINLCETNNVQYNIAVPHNIIGPKQKYDDPFRNVVSIMTNLMLQNRKPIIYGDGEQKRSFSDIDDCIFCLDKLLLDQSINKQILNIGPDENFITINDLYKILSNKLQFNLPAEYHLDRPNEVKHANCSSEKSRKLLGYKTSVELKDSIQKVVDFIKMEGPKKFKYNYKIEIDSELVPITWREKKF